MIHQMRKLAATYAIKAGQDGKLVKMKLGFSDVRNLRKNYVAEAQQLRGSSTDSSVPVMEPLNIFK